MQAFIHFPGWLKPEVFPGFPIRWYGIMYLVAFSIAYSLMVRQLRQDKLTLSEDDLMNSFLWGIVGLLIGARLFATTIYDPTHYYLQHPWMIFWPFRNGQFTGLQGMSYHGGVVGGIIGTLLYCRRKNINWFMLADLYGAGIPLGYTFGRLGNFINGELWGRVTVRPWGIVFPHAGRFPVSENWVQRIAAEIGMKLPQSGMVNLPRHPSQLYEAFFEGIILWAFLWFVIRRRKKFHGAVISFYLIGYGVVRFIIEYFREPDYDMGFPLQFGGTGESPALFHSFLNISTGQLLCALMIGGGVILYFICKKIAASPGSIESNDDEPASRHGSIRKKRKKIK